MVSPRLLVLAVMAVSVLSYGAVASAQTQLPFSVQTDQELYAEGNTVTISGNVKDYADLSIKNDVTLIVKNPTGNIVNVRQITPNATGTYTTTLLAEGNLWKAGGEYTIEANFGPQKITTTFEFAGISGTAAPPTIICSSNQELRDGVCVDKEPTCEPGTSNVGGVCVPDEQTPPPPPPPPAPPAEVVPECADDEELIDDECVQKQPDCGEGTILRDGQCVVDPSTNTGNGGGNGRCMIATAAYGSELAPQVQFLREVRDSTLMSTESGSTFMAGFNTVYYSFAPAVAELELEYPAFREAVRLFITPMISTLSIMSLAEEGSEYQVVGLGISAIALNLGMYIAAPAVIGIKVRSHLKSKRQH